MKVGVAADFGKVSIQPLVTLADRVRGAFAQDKPGGFHQGKARKLIPKWDPSHEVVGLTLGAGRSA